jgi:hypothetical protein
MNIDERLEALVQTVELMAAMQKHAGEEYEERQLRMDERLIEIDERHAAAIADIRNQLNRAVRLSIQEARNERRRRHELEEQERKHRQELDARLTKRHEELQELLKAFLERGGNGKH